MSPDRPCLRNPLELVRDIQAGASGAEEELARSCGGCVYLLAVVRTRDRTAAADLVHETLLAVILALRRGRLRQPESLPAFIHATARHQVFNYLRTVRRRREDPLIDDQPHAPQRRHDDRERRRLVRHALRRLEANDRRLLMMTLTEGLKPGEIARRLGITPQAARARKSRALRKVIAHVRWMTDGRGACLLDEDSIA